MSLYLGTKPGASYYLKRALQAAAALAPLFIATGSGAAEPERPDHVPPGSPYIEYYEGRVRVKGWVLSVDPEGETFDFYDATGRFEAPGRPFNLLPVTDRARLRKWAGARSGGDPAGEGSTRPSWAGDVEMVEATKFHLKNAPPVVGIEIDEMSTKDAICIRTRTVRLFPIPRERVLRTEKVMVPVKDVFPPGYLYEKWRSEIDPRSAEDNYRLAWKCWLIGEYLRAHEHLERAKRLDPRFETQADMKLRELAFVIRAKTVRELDVKIAAFLRGEQYQQALAAIERLGRLDPRSGEYHRWALKVGEIEAKLARNLRFEIVNSYYLKMDELIRKWAWGSVTVGPYIPGKYAMTEGGTTYQGRLIDETDDMITLESKGGRIEIEKSIIRVIEPINMSKDRRDATFAESREYVTAAEGGLRAEIVDALADRYGELIEAHVASRRKDEAEGRSGRPPAPSFAKATEGSVVRSSAGAKGDAPVQTPGGASGEGTAPPAPAISREELKTEIRKLWDARLDDVRRVTRRGVEHIPAAATPHKASYGPGSWLREGAIEKVKIAGAEIPDPETWWRKLARVRDVRYQILRAMAAEAHCKVDREEKPRCSGCGGRGYLIRIAAMGRTVMRLCQQCKGIGGSYVIRYR